jgi:hypothetical protein
MPIRNRIIFIFALLANLPLASSAVSINFESLPDSSDVGTFYQASYGLTFQSTIALTAGFSLNEFDFPPHSGVMAIGDNVENDGDPMILTFTHSVNSLSAYFVYGSTLTFSAYDKDGLLLGTYVTPEDTHLGSDQLIELPFSHFQTLNISGETANSFIMDDLTFSADETRSVPDGGNTLVLFCGALVTLFAFNRFKMRSLKSRPL